MAQVFVLATRLPATPFEEAKPLFEFILEQLDELHAKFGPQMFTATADSLTLWMRIWTQMSAYFRSNHWEGETDWEALCQRFARYAGQAKGGRKPSSQQLASAMVLMGFSKPIPTPLRQAVLAIAA
jgi:hypothetical protein